MKNSNIFNVDIRNYMGDLYEFERAAFDQGRSPSYLKKLREIYEHINMKLAAYDRALNMSVVDLQAALARSYGNFVEHIKRNLAKKSKYTWRTKFALRRLLVKFPNYKVAKMAAERASTTHDPVSVSNHVFEQYVVERVISELQRQEETGKERDIVLLLGAAHVERIFKGVKDYLLQKKERTGNRDEGYDSDSSSSYHSIGMIDGVAVRLN